MQRVLSVSLSHAIRSAAFLILPFSFISLVAWATAGSASGTTTDPIRGAVWIWLGSHHIPFQLTLPPSGIPGYLTYLPIGAVVLPFLVIRTTFARALDRLKGDFHDLNGVRFLFSIIYATLTTALAFASRSTAIAPQWYLSPIFAFLISFLACMTVGYRLTPSRTLVTATRALALIFGASFILVSILIFVNFSQVKNITTSLQPGILGGVLLLALNILYLPNAAVGVVSYFSGSGIAVGTDTVVSPLWYQLGEIPALPLLGILPVNKQPWALIGILFFVGVGVLLALITRDSQLQGVIQTFAFTVTGILIFAYLASGSLITAEMGSLGVSIWKLTLSLFVEMSVGLLATTLILSKARK